MKEQSCFDQPPGTRVASCNDLFFKGHIIDALPAYLRGAESGMVHAMRTFIHMNENRFREAILEGRVYIHTNEVINALKQVIALTNIEAGCFQRAAQHFIDQENVNMDEVRQFVKDIAPHYLDEHAIEKIMQYLHVALFQPEVLNI